MLSTYLSGGKSSVLYKKLVDKKKLALEATSINLGQVDYNMFAFFALPLGDVKLTTLLSEIDEEIVKVPSKRLEEKSDSILKHPPRVPYFRHDSIVY